ncbi:MAG: hypothetical protein CMP76_14310 [Flavobacterium sp.]|uniref:DUF4249 domain-containing protein n=1 Tax=Flavobacterium sp. TaxID=239 RepID=UPI000C4E10C0|nr:DUF4249 domain-containing protein [Flavobacterium sp.]MBF04456.1 hypothetical protein [Flavobacterium sp.]
MKLKQYIVLIFIAIVSCTEPYELQTENFEDLLVVEATITNEYKKHNITLSRTIPLESELPNIEHGASVMITTNTGLEFPFSEVGDTYISNQEFQIEPNLLYTLKITTSNGKSYISNSETMPATSQISEVTATQEIKENELGVAINVNSTDPNNASKFYRYEFIETYIVIPPYWSPNKLIVDSNNQLQLVPRTEETQICYSNNFSNTINVTTTENQTEDIVSDFNIHFIRKNDPKIAHRYSVLVRQYIQNPEANNFYKTLKTLSATGSLLSQVQPGFINGNIKSVTNPDEKVVGYFDVTTVSEKRIFFNFEDIFPSETSESYLFSCNIFEYRSDIDELPIGYMGLEVGARNDMKYVTQAGILIYASGDLENEENIILVYPNCTDCTSFSSNVQPDFWQ